MRSDSVVVRYLALRAAPFIQLYALYVLGHGEDGPGGGFQGGVIFSASFVLMALAYGWPFGRRQVNQQVTDLLAPTGALIYAGIGALAILAGGAFLQYGAFAHAGGEDPEAARLHAQHFGLMGIEIGVMITVASSMAILFFEMSRPGDGPPPPADPEVVTPETVAPETVDPEAVNPDAGGAAPEGRAR